MRRCSVIATLLLALIAPALPALAAWPHDPAVNLPVTATPSTGQYLFGGSEAVSDGQGGIICFWNEFSTFDNIRAQRIDAAGNRLWGDSGIQIVAGTVVQQFAMSAIPDGVGGAILAWLDPRNGTRDIYAQRVDADGNPLWTAGGVAVCTASGDQTEVQLSSDGTGGAWIVWTDARFGAATDIYARRVNAAGVPQGVANGVAVSAAAGIQRSPRVTGMLGLSGCTIAWWDQRTDGGDIYGQRMDFSGTPAWAANGAVICNAVGTQHTPLIVHDGGSGSFVAWTDGRSGLDVYAQRLNSAAGTYWAANGIPVSAAANGQTLTGLALDGAGGALLAFNDFRNFSTDIYAHRISLESGLAVWAADGVPVCTEPGVQSAALVVADGLGGAYVAWRDERQNVFGDIYAQRLSSGGAIQWNATGVAVAVSPGYEYGHSLVSAGADGMLVQAVHEAVAVPGKASAQKVDRWGYLGAEPFLVSATDVPNDEGGKVKVSWLASPLDPDPVFGNVSDYTVYRSVPEGVALAALAAGRVTDAAEAGAAVTGVPRIVRTVSPSGVTSYWEAAGYQAAQHLDAYSLVVPTTGDSVAGSNPLTEFMVQARSWSGGWWNSDSRLGYSVDDLAPATPAPFEGLYAGGTTLLNWGANDEPDLSHYRLYRGVGDFVPSSGNRIAEPQTTTFSDAAGGPYVYKLSAVDIHGNESAAATVLPDGAVGVEEPTVRRVFFAEPAPHPIRAGAGVTLRFGIARAGHVTLSVHDLQGRKVARLLDATLEAGEHVAPWSPNGGRATLGPGVYFAHLDGPGIAAVRRLVVVD